MTHPPAIINNISIENNLLQATIRSPSLHQSFPIEIDLEEDSTNPADFDGLINELQRLIVYLTPVQLQEITASIAREITTSAYQQSGYIPTADDFTALENDLKLVKVIAFPEGFALDYIAEKLSG
ncbi:hypothetical protein [Chitinophaga sp. RAB17]|uniref:hypothetical protein n=1 Tax=Chitinophaga sp. RAB17 TaxID=3233049 RepID=UPI003F909B1B